MSAAQIITDGIWSWFSSPPVYVSADGAIYFQWVTHLGTICAGKYVLNPATLEQYTLHTALEVDDHDSGGIYELANGSLVSAYGKHAIAGQYRRISTNASDVRAWGSEGSLTSDSITFANLWQSGDTAGTVWNFIQGGASAPQTVGYYTSTNNGTSWSSYTEIWAPVSGGSQPHPKLIPNGANRVDFLLPSGHPVYVAVNLYHMYMTVNSSGVPSFFASDGTSLGSPPFSPSTFASLPVSLIYNGSSTNAMEWDIQIIGGQPNVAFIVFPNGAGAAITDSTAAEIQYYRGVWNGAAWSTELICEAGDATLTGGTRQDWLYAAEPDYAGGICLDPNDSTSVYVSRTYNSSSGVRATDCRLEKWTKTAGTWAKAVDISGATSSLNCRPRAVRSLSPTQILYWSAASYSSYTSWSGSNLWAYPALPLYATKVSLPTWIGANGPIGTQAYWLLAEGTGTQTKELVSGYECPFIGSPTWGTNAYGATLGGFSSTIAVNSDGTASALAAAANSSAGYPRYLWALWSNTAAGDAQYVVQFGNSGSTNDIWALVVWATTGYVTAVLRDHAGNSEQVTTTFKYTSTAVSDGNPHLLVMLSTSASSHTLYLDGVSVATDTSTIGAYTFQNLTLGAIRRDATQSNPFLGNLIASGWGLGSPDMTNFYNDIWGGQFGGTRALGTSGAGAAALGALLAAGTATAAGASPSSGTGAATWSAFVAAGVGGFTAAATGAATWSALAAGGVGTAEAVNATTGTGAAALAALAASGIGTFTCTAVGTAFLPAMIAAGLSGFGQALQPGPQMSLVVTTADVFGGPHITVVT